MKNFVPLQCKISTEVQSRPTALQSQKLRVEGSNALRG